MMREREHVIDVSAHLNAIPIEDGFYLVGLFVDSKNAALFDSWDGVDCSRNEIVAGRQGYKVISSPLRLFDWVDSTEQCVSERSYFVDHLFDNRAVALSQKKDFILFHYSGNP